jgi:hypothetical protein
MEVQSVLRSYVVADTRHMESTGAHVQATWDD